MSVPAGSWHGLPINVSFLGRRFDEALLLQIAHAYEQVAQQHMEPTYLPTLDIEALFRDALVDN